MCHGPLCHGPNISSVTYLDVRGSRSRQKHDDRGCRSCSHRSPGQSDVQRSYAAPWRHDLHWLAAATYCYEKIEPGLLDLLTYPLFTDGFQRGNRGVTYLANRQCAFMSWPDIDIICAGIRRSDPAPVLSTFEPQHVAQPPQLRSTFVNTDNLARLIDFAFVLHGCYGSAYLPLCLPKSVLVEFDAQIARPRPIVAW